MEWFIKSILLWQANNMVKAAISASFYVFLLMLLFVPYPKWFAFQPFK
jgi:hypothetical protein